MSPFNFPLPPSPNPIVAVDTGCTLTVTLSWSGSLHKGVDDEMGLPFPITVPLPSFPFPHRSLARGMTTPDMKEARLKLLSFILL